MLLAISSQEITAAGISVITLVLSIAVHEYFHALAAWKLGDGTAEAEGRLTLNPISHADPIGTLAGTYEALGLGSFGPFQPRLQARLDGLADYRTNDYADLDEARRAQVVERWAPIYERWGYA